MSFEIRIGDKVIACDEDLFHALDIARDACVRRRKDVNVYRVSDGAHLATAVLHDEEFFFEAWRAEWPGSPNLFVLELEVA